MLVKRRLKNRTYHHQKTEFRHHTVDSDLFTEEEARIFSGKRALDLVIGSIGYVVYLILFPFIALGIKLSSRGPVIYRQKRTGINGEIFYCYKFRTMHMVGKYQQNGKPDITKKNDPRIFAFGQFLRKMNLDELPQIKNVLNGDMSLVGPRPYPVEECSYWNSVFNDHYYRYIMKPGITGLAQVKGYRGGTLDENLMRTRLNFDLIYIEKNSLILDLHIIFKTMLQMLVRKTNGH